MEYMGDGWLPCLYKITRIISEKKNASGSVKCGDRHLHTFNPSPKEAQVVKSRDDGSLVYITGSKPAV